MGYKVQRKDRVLLRGFRDGLPIGLGYFAVSFSLGIAARNAGMNAIQGFVLSFLNNASAGEYAGIAAIKTSATYLEMALLILVTNARYLMMSCALSQKLSPKMKWWHRLLIGFDITDELFGIGIAQPYPLNPYYMYGAYAIALPAWAGGTALGVIAGNLLPVKLVLALSASIYGMFIAIIIPPCKKDKAVLFVVLVSFIVSAGLYFVPWIKMISESLRIIILTLVIAAAAAILFPHHEEEEEQN